MSSKSTDSLILRWDDVEYPIHRMRDEYDGQITYSVFFDDLGYVAMPAKFWMLLSEGVEKMEYRNHPAAAYLKAKGYNIQPGEYGVGWDLLDKATCDKAKEALGKMPALLLNSGLEKWAKAEGWGE